MKSLVAKLLIGVAALVTAAAPPPASAQPWHEGNRGYYQAERRHHEFERRQWERRQWEHRLWERRQWERRQWELRHRAVYRQSFYARPAYYRPPFNGYYGISPAGYHAYYYNGGWYPHRRWRNGVWIYFRI
jgi:hypothetical protein